MKPLLIVKTGTTLPGVVARLGDFEDWITRGLGIPEHRVQVAAVYRGEQLPHPDQIAGVVVTGSSAMVSAREGWSERSAAWIRVLLEQRTPLLGICYGHQLLAHAAGGLVGPNPRGREIGTVEVELSPERDGTPLAVLPDVVSVHSTHVESVLELPAGAIRLASNRNDPNCAFSLGDHAWGVQWHPEFDAQVMCAYLEGRREILIEEGFDPDALIGKTGDSPHGPTLLRRFGEIAMGEASRPAVGAP